MPKLKYILLYHTLFHFATGYAPARTVSPYSENLRYWMTSASRSDVFASLIVMYCADGAKTILYRFHMTFLSVHIVVCRVSTLRLHSTWHTPCSAEKRWQENCRDRCPRLSAFKLTYRTSRIVVAPRSIHSLLQLLALW